MQIIRSRIVHDVVIVGSGAGGGMAAKVLTEAGANVLMLPMIGRLLTLNRHLDDSVPPQPAQPRPPQPQAPQAT